MTQIHDLETLLFDLDGTLVDSADLIVESWRHTMLAHFGEIPPDEVWLRTMGMPLRTQFQDFVDTAEGVQAMIDTYVDHNRREHDRLIRSFEGVREALAQLHLGGVRMGIVTSKAARGTAMGLAACNLDTSWFETLVTSDEPIPHKPDPAPVLLALDRLGVDASGAAFVGDSVWDLRAGRAAGVQSIAALWGPFTRELLEAENPDHMLDHISELLPDATR